jgi:hypothetical protein
MPDTIELTARQRERIEAIKRECKNDHMPAPPDSQVLSSLLDTWDAVNEGYYSDE